MAAPHPTSAASTPGLGRWCLILIFTGVVTGRLDVRNPHALELADSVNSEFFAPVGNILITSRETEELVRNCYLPSVRKHLTAFDGDNTAAQQSTNVLLERPRWLCCTGYGYDRITVR